MSKRKRVTSAKANGNKKQKLNSSYEWPITIVENSPFELEELTEIILSHLIVADPISVVNIAITSKRNNATVRSRRFWTKFGFDLMTDSDRVPSDIIKAILGQYRLEQIQKQMYLLQSEMSALLTRVTLPTALHQNIETQIQRPKQAAYPIDSRAYLAHHHQFTEQALEVLLRVKSLFYVSFFQFTDLVKFIEGSKKEFEACKPMSFIESFPFSAPDNFMSRDVACKVKMFQKNATKSQEFRLLYDVESLSSEALVFQIWKKFLPKNRSVLLILGYFASNTDENGGYAEEDEHRAASLFLKYDANSGVIEECCKISDYAARNFPAMPNDVWKRVMCAVSESKNINLKNFPPLNRIQLYDTTAAADRDTFLYRNIKLRK